MELKMYGIINHWDMVSGINREEVSLWRLKCMV